MESRLELAKAIAREAGGIQVHAAGALGVESKDGAELVTRVDVECQELISRRIRERYPEDSFLGEEGGGRVALDAERLWVVDPLDGTNNFVHGIPQFSVSIAYAERGEVLLGVVYDPNRDELFSGVKGGGATRDAEPINVTGRDRIAGLMVGTGFYYDRGETMRRTLRAIERLFDENIRGIRRFGSAALDLSWLACGRLDAFFEYHLSPWDFAAGALIAREAGARITDRDGIALTLDSGSLVGANPRVFDAVLDIVRYER